VNALSERISRLIALGGPIAISDYMALAMHDRALGYYSTRDPLGPTGDFITAPEISQTFGELLALWCIEQWRNQGAPDRVRLIELGPGRGTLMKDFLRAADIVPEFRGAVDITLVESNPVLQKLQKENIAGTRAGIAWRRELEPQLFDRPVFVLANEFFDALPVRQFVRARNGWHERMVGLDAAGSLAFVNAPFAVDHRVPASLKDSALGAVYEVSDAAQSLMRMIASGIANLGGAALVIDYGYDVPSLSSTLSAVRAHARADPLESPGEADLSAHVDFGALSAVARSEGAAVFGPTSQGAFLHGLGIGVRAEALGREKDDETRARIRSEVNRLIAPDQMGELFKALSVLPKSAVRPSGF